MTLPITLQKPWSSESENEAADDTGASRGDGTKAEFKVSDDSGVSKDTKAEVKVKDEVEERKKKRTVIYKQYGNRLLLHRHDRMSIPRLGGNV